MVFWRHWRCEKYNVVGFNKNVVKITTFFARWGLKISWGGGGYNGGVVCKCYEGMGEHALLANVVVSP